jgi:hypothetical protein
MTSRSCPWCGCAAVIDLAVHDAPLPGEKIFAIPPDRYRRTLWRCPICGHLGNRHDHDQALAAAYRGDYHAQAHGASLAAGFARIMALPPTQSDNRRRVADLGRDLAELRRPSSGRLLDIGSGSAVFGAAMRQDGWRVTALDPDPVAARHAEMIAGLTAIVGGVAALDPAALGQFDLVTFNKVLEHLPPGDALAALRAAAAVLTAQGLVYVELPDGETAARRSLERQEFFLEHYGAFSAASTALLGQRAGFELLLLRRVTEPSGKLTLRGFFARSCS